MHLLVVKPESGRTLRLSPHIDRTGWIIPDPHHRDSWGPGEGLNPGSQGLEHRARHDTTIENLRHQSLEPEEDVPALSPALDLLVLSPEPELELPLSPELGLLALSPALVLPVLPVSPVEPVSPVSPVEPVALLRP